MKHPNTDEKSVNSHCVSLYMVIRPNVVPSVLNYPPFVYLSARVIKKNDNLKRCIMSGLLTRLIIIIIIFIYTSTVLSMDVLFFFLC